MNDSIIAFGAKEQLGKFLGKVFAHFSKPRKKFLADMLYGIQASGDTQLWSSRAPGHLGENDEVLKLIASIMAATGGKGTLVYDRGGDRPAFYKAFIENGWDFIVRMTGRNVLSWNGLHEIHWLARQCTMRHHHHVEFDSHGKECSVHGLAVAGKKGRSKRCGRLPLALLQHLPNRNVVELLQLRPGPPLPAIYEVIARTRRKTQRRVSQSRQAVCARPRQRSTHGERHD